MTNKKEITCIVCPIGCKILVEKTGKKVEVCSGNKCKKGVDYSIYEALDPRRILTTSILVEHGEWPLVSVKSSRPVPKDKIFDVLEEIREVKTEAPVKLGNILIKNVAQTGIDIISTKSIKKCS
jgi:CxxC motif-containing protein